ncbi:MAG: hypothetical protein HKP61_09295 [Dactylosporangium sp.]|nr:hypothetical protein [Dactylosporangium sp.]NNJ61127.1 hypothetical protein [Dactylosporangium sp.]
MVIRSRQRFRANVPTPQLLRRLRAALIGVVVVTVVGCLGVVLGARAAAVAVDEKVVPATAAISAIWNSLRATDPQLSGCALDPAPDVQRPDCGALLASGRYRIVLANVVQQLAGLAERTIGDVTDRQSIQTVQGYLIRYLGLVEQAHYYLGQNRPLLVEAYLDYASGLLRGSILLSLNEVRADIAAELGDQRTSPWRSPWMALAWLVPLLSGLGLLAATQRYLMIRFNRRINWPLATATVGLIALGIGAGQPLWDSADFGHVTRQLHELLRIDLAIDATARPPGDGLIATASSATRSFHLEYIVPMIAVTVLALVVVGFQHRLDEYRLRSR